MNPTKCALIRWLVPPVYESFRKYVLLSRLHVDRSIIIYTYHIYNHHRVQQKSCMTQDLKRLLKHAPLEASPSFPYPQTLTISSIMTDTNIYLSDIPYMAGNKWRRTENIFPFNFLLLDWKILWHCHYAVFCSRSYVTNSYSTVIITNSYWPCLLIF